MKIIAPDKTPRKPKLIQIKNCKNYSINKWVKQAEMIRNAFIHDPQSQPDATQISLKVKTSSRDDFKANIPDKNASLTIKAKFKNSNSLKPFKYTIPH